jgi:hypothetical protein
VEPRSLADIARAYGVVLLLQFGSTFRRYQDHRRYLALERPYVDRVLRTLVPP